MGAKDVLGRRGEDLAAEYLLRLGHELIDRNWRCRYGEIDLVTREGAEIVFTEVKSRSSTRSGHPFEAITGEKLGRMRLLAGLWSAVHPQHLGRLRLDVVGVVLRPDQPPVIRQLRAVGA